ncbi:hypothetical protein JTB14_005482 [Gonioctena quinquepunctata]|nr:hypothetical protein JTB14_005482 [Gonioctena quinquepunctata]
MDPSGSTDSGEGLVPTVTGFDNLQAALNFETFGLPSRTIRQHFTIAKCLQCFPQETYPTFGFLNENQLAHTQKLVKSRYPPDRKTVRSLVYQL